MTAGVAGSYAPSNRSPSSAMFRFHVARSAFPTYSMGKVEILIVAPEQLGGGSVTLGGRLIELGAVSDLPLIKQLVAEIGADWAKAKVTYGAWEFVG